MNAIDVCRAINESPGKWRLTRIGPYGTEIQDVLEAVVLPRKGSFDLSHVKTRRGIFCYDQDDLAEDDGAGGYKISVKTPSGNMFCDHLQSISPRTDRILILDDTP